jgi:hypothetical protein
VLKISGESASSDTARANDIASTRALKARIALDLLAPDQERHQREASMTTIKAFRLASVVTAIDVLVASGFSIVGIVRPQYLLPAGSVPTQASLILAMYAAARTIPLAFFALGAIYKQATQALLFLGALAGTMQLLDAGIGLFERDLGKCAGPLLIAVLQFFVVYLLHRSVRIMPEATRG